MKIPTGEKIVITYLFSGVKEYIVTQNMLKGKFVLYKILAGGYERIHTANSPAGFQEIAEQDRSR